MLHLDFASSIQILLDVSISGSAVSMQIPSNANTHEFSQVLIENVCANLAGR
jgi:hypothetical protein